MLETFRKGRRWWTAAVVVFVGGVFAVFIGLGGPLRGGGGSAVVEVGPYRVSLAEFERTRAMREDEMRQTLGEAFDARKLRDTLDMLTAQVLVQRAILALEAERLGLRVAKQEVEREILASQGFRGEDGRFDKQAFDRWVSYEFGSEKAFVEQQRRAALATKLLRVIQAQATVSEGEARDAVARRLERVKVAFPLLDAGRIPDDFPRDDAAIQALLAAREQEVRDLYAARADEYDVPERARARHVLVRVAEGSSQEEEAEARARVEAALARIRGGEEFAAVAEEVSEDPGSKANGGDLGFFRRGQMVEAFDQAAFSLEPGAVSEPVRSVYGWHLIRVEERKPAELRSFEDVRADLAHEILGREAGRKLAWETAEKLAEAVRGGQSLEAAARAAELTLERTGWVERRPDGFVPGLGAAPEVVAVAFTLEPGASSPRIFEVAEKLALVQVLERQEPKPEEVAKQLDAERERLAAEKLDALMSAWINDRRAQLMEAGQLSVNLDLLGRSG
jgi:peptidyl-prolyl cis-trans isomerase D